MAKFQQPNMANLMKQAQKMQQDMQKAQEELMQMTFEATSGGGAVKAVVSGEKKLVSLDIDDEILNPDDKDMLVDMIIVALNEAMEKAEQTTQDKLSKVTGGMGLSGLM